MLRLVLASAIVACTSAFAPSGVPAAGRFFQRPALSARVSPLASVAGGRSQVRAASLGLRCAEDADLSLFSSGSGPAEFCSELTQTEHIELAGNRALKTSADTPAFAIFGSGKMAGIEQMSVKVRPNSPAALHFGSLEGNHRETLYATRPLPVSHR